jgi:hypothetical protein
MDARVADPSLEGLATAAGNRAEGGRDQRERDDEWSVPASPSRPQSDQDGSEGRKGEQDDDSVNDQRMQGEAIDEVKHGELQMGSAHPIE